VIFLIRLACIIRFSLFMTGADELYSESLDVISSVLLRVLNDLCKLAISSTSILHQLGE